MHFTQYGRRLKVTLISGMSVACLACIVAIPFVEKKLFNTSAGYYSIQFNGQEVGAANTRAEAEDALAAARLKFSKEYDSVIYMDSSIDIVKQNKAVASRMNQEELEDALYSTMFECVSDKEEATAYTLRIDDYTVTLASKDDIVELLQRVTAKYDAKNEFQVKLASGDSSYGSYSVEVVKSDIKETATDIVAATLNGDSSLNTETGSGSYSDGTIGITYEQSISIDETQTKNAKISTVDEAYDDITQEKQAKTYHIVELGDCLSSIADKYDISLSELLALNEDLTENSVIKPGDEIVVTVPRSKISAAITVRKTYEEDFDAEIEYVDDDTQYVGYTKVISEGTSGHHKVTAEITTVNGVQTSLVYIEETVTVEPVAQVVAVGTLTPPTYLKPVNGRYSSGYGYRDGSTHKGVDWSCSIGTPVYAAASGTVIRAGWYSGYGYCVDIRHSDGSMTRYGHLNSVAVSVGQTVSQSSLIAYSGNTGDSSGPHLHFEIWINGATVNPLNYVNKN